MRKNFTATIKGFEQHEHSNKPLIRLEKVKDSEGNLIAYSMTLFRGKWDRNVSIGDNLDFSAKVETSERRIFDGTERYTVRETRLANPQVIHR